MGISSVKLYEVIHKLNKIVLNIYRKIYKENGNSYNHPKQELTKLNYNLLARYLIVNEEDEKITAQKILKRIVKNLFK